MLSCCSFNIFIDVVKVKNFPKASNYKILLFFCQKFLGWRPSEAKLDLVFKTRIVHVFAHWV